jgi:hypothetical protein
MNIGKVVLSLGLAMGGTLPAAAEPNIDPNVAERAANSADMIRFRTEASAEVRDSGKPCKSPRRAKAKDRKPQKPIGS